jgi:uncharacterized protein YuzE
MPVQVNGFRADYDREADSLFIYEKGQKSKKTITVGDMVLDFRNGKAVAVELLDFSKKVSYLTDKKVVPAELKKVSGCRLSTCEVRGGVAVKWKCFVAARLEERQPIAEEIVISDLVRADQILA